MTFAYLIGLNLIFYFVSILQIQIVYNQLSLEYIKSQKAEHLSWKLKLNKLENYLATKSFPQSKTKSLNDNQLDEFTTKLLFKFFVTNLKNTSLNKTLTTFEKKYLNLLLFTLFMK